MSVMGNEFSGLPMDELIGGPLKAACDAQIRLAKATSDFINTVGFNPELDSNNKPTGKLVPKQVDFSFWQPLPIARPLKVTGVTIANPGSGYTPPPTVTFSPAPAGGTTATGTATLDSSGKVTGVTITNPGLGYTTAPTVTFSLPPAGGTQAMAGAVTVDGSGKVTGVAIATPGLYPPPTVTFSDPPAGGTKATGTATVDSSGKVTGVTITSSGSGYTSAPTVSFSGGGGIGAAGTGLVEPDTSLSNETQVQKVVLSVPFLVIVNVPALMVKSVDITFDMEVKSSETHKDESSQEASLDASAKVGWGPFSAEVKIHGAISAHQENTRSTDRSAKYHVQVTARDDGMPEGLSRVLDMLQKAIAPVSVSKAATLQNANVAQNQKAVA